MESNTQEFAALLTKPKLGPLAKRNNSTSMPSVSNSDKHPWRVKSRFISHSQEDLVDYFLFPHSALLIWEMEFEFLTTVPRGIC